MENKDKINKEEEFLTETKNKKTKKSDTNVDLGETKKGDTVTPDTKEESTSTKLPFIIVKGLELSGDRVRINCVSHYIESTGKVVVGFNVFDGTKNEYVEFEDVQSVIEFLTSKYEQYGSQLKIKNSRRR